MNYNMSVVLHFKVSALNVGSARDKITKLSIHDLLNSLEVPLGVEYIREDIVQQLTLVKGGREND